MPRKRKATPAATQLALNTDRLDRIEPVLEKIAERLTAIERELFRYKGFWGGITLIGGALAAMVTLFKDAVLALFQR